MNQKGFKFNSVLLAMVMAAQANAQATTQQSDVEVIEVKGIKGSLNKSAAIKRDSKGIVDAISAEDIGKFPDTNLAESLQRITGVSIDRANNEGNQVTVRGFGPSFNLVTLNGRQMPNSSALLSEGISRSFNFNELSAESVSGVEVNKTGRAELNSGGIGAAINITTAKPFDFQGLKAIGSVKGVLDQSVDKGDTITPEFSGMVSNTFLDDTVGVLFSASHAVRHSHTDRIGTSGSWGTGYPGQVDIDKSNINTSLNPDQNSWGVPTVDLDAQDTERERLNSQLVVQWAPTDNIVATVDYTMSRLDTKSDMNRTSFWFDNIETGTADANGTIITPARSNDELNFWAWEYAFETENDSIGLNIEWMATDTLKVTFDAHDSTSHANPGALPAEVIANLKNPFGDAAPVHIAADFSGDIPSVSYDDSGFSGAGLTGDAFTQANIEGDLYQERGYEIENNIQQISLAGELDLDGEFGISTLQFGFSNTAYTIDTKNIYGANFGLGGGAMDISALDLSFSEGDIGFEQRSSYSAAQFMDLVEAQGLLNEKGISTNGVEEDTIAVFVAANIETELSSMPFKANLGLRYESTDVSSYSLENPVTGFNWITPLEMSKVRADSEQSSVLTGDYTNLLPSLNLSLEIQDGLIARFGYSHTIARSNIDAMFPATSLDNHFSGGPFKASQGNPDLLPYESVNLDLSAEYYYDEASYVSVGYYTKDVDNYISVGEEDRIIEGPNGPLTDPSVTPRGVCPEGSVASPNPDCLSQATDPAIVWEVTTPINLDSTTVDGWELNIQHMFSDTGFGGIANYTAVNTSDEYKPHILENDFAVSGLSDSANLVGFYEKDAFSIRVAYNWRDEFLLSAGSSPVFTEAYSQIDISASYDISENLSVFIDGINITEEDVRRHGRFSNQIVDFEQYGARYTIGVRGSL